MWTEIIVGSERFIAEYYYIEADCEEAVDIMRQFIPTSGVMGNLWLERITLREVTGIERGCRQAMRSAYEWYILEPEHPVPYGAIVAEGIKPYIRLEDFIRQANVHIITKNEIAQLRANSGKLDFKRFGF